MCMLFILQQAHDDYKRGLRGVQRLLCTLLCTRSDPSEDIRQRCTGMISWSATPPRMIVTFPFHPRRKRFWVPEALEGIPSVDWRCLVWKEPEPKREIPRIFAFV